MKYRPSVQTFAKNEVYYRRLSLDLLLWLAHNQGKLVRSAKVFAVSTSSWYSLSLKHITRSHRGLPFMTRSQGWVAVPALELPQVRRTAGRRCQSNDHLQGRAYHTGLRHEKYSFSVLR